MLTSRRNTTIHAQSFVVRKDKDLMTPTVTQAFSIIYCTNNIILYYIIIIIDEYSVYPPVQLLCIRYTCRRYLYCIDISYTIATFTILYIASPLTAMSHRTTLRRGRDVVLPRRPRPSGPGRDQWGSARVV